MSIRKNRIACQGVTNQSQMSLIANKSVPYLKIPDKTATLNTKLLKTTIQDHNKSKYDSPNMKLTTQNTTNMQQYCDNKQNNKQRSNRLKDESGFKQSKKFANLLCSKDKLNKLGTSQVQQKWKQNTNVSKAIQKIRTTYKYNANVRKIIKAWGFQNKGCISDCQFKEMINRHFDPSITKQDCQQLFKSISGRKQNLDILKFIKLVFDQQPFTKPHVNVFDNITIKNTNTLNGQNFSQQTNKQTSKTLMNKIQNLNEGSIYQHINKNMHKSFILPQLKDKNGQFKDKTNSQSIHQMSASFNLDKFHSLEKTQPSLYQTLWSQSNPKYTFSTTKSHAVDFTPTMFYGQNQQKTRFGATAAIQLNDQSLPQNKRQKLMDQKQKVMNQLYKERMLQKIRYENKLQKIRNHQQQQKQNINMIDYKTQLRDQSNMKRFRQQNIAYNYVNFIHNDWK